MTDIDLTPTVIALAKEMGGTIETKEINWSATIRTKQGPLLFVRIDRKRLEFSQSFPRIKNDTSACSVTVRDLLTGEERRENKHCLEITVSASRPVKDIARDIERRLMPTLIEMHARALAHIAKWEKYNEDQAQAVRTLCKSLRGTLRKDTSNVVYLDDAPTLTVRGPDSVHFDSLDVTPEQAIAIVQLLRKLKVR